MTLMSAPVKPPPEAPEAEASLLGALLVDPTAFELSVLGRIQPEDLSREAHRLILATIERLYEQGRPTNFSTVQQELAIRGELPAVGGAQFLVGLMQGIPTTAHVATYALLVERAALLRRLISAANEIAHLALTRDDSLNALKDAQELLYTVGEASLKREVTSLSDALHDFAAYTGTLAGGRPVGIPTGFATLDAKTGGLQPSDLIILAGRPSLGKTSFALALVANASIAHHKTCAVFSMEMNDEKIAQRLLSMRSEVDGSRLRHGRLSARELDAISLASAEVQQGPIYVDESTRLTVTDVLAKCRRLQAEASLDLVVVDYLQLMESKNDAENRVQEIARITRGLKAVARELQVPVIALSQLSRQIETRGNEPMLSDLRESGSIEQDADLVLFLWQERKDRDENVVRLKLAKHRNGPTGDIDMYFQPELTTFRDLGETRAHTQ